MEYIDFFPDCKTCRYLDCEVLMTGYDDGMQIWYSCCMRDDERLVRNCPYRKESCA